jgi:hypothetical protein
MQFLVRVAMPLHVPLGVIRVGIGGFVFMGWRFLLLIRRVFPRRLLPALIEKDRRRVITSS